MLGLSRTDIDQERVYIESSHSADRCVVVLNFSAEPQTVELPAQYAGAQVVLSTQPDAPPSLSPIDLRTGDGLLIRV